MGDRVPRRDECLAAVGITSSPSTALLIAVQSCHGVDVTGIGVVHQRVQSGLTWLRLVARGSPS